LQELKHNEMKLAEEQRWAKAHAACFHATADQIQE
jgi:hypothetical protein